MSNRDEHCNDSPPGSTAAPPLWFLHSSGFRMGRAPSVLSECWRACWVSRRTWLPEAQLQQTLCQHWLPVPAEIEKGTSVAINADVKTGFTAWLIFLINFVRLEEMKEPESGHVADSATLQQRKIIPQAMLSKAWLQLNAVLQCWENGRVVFGQESNAPQETTPKVEHIRGDWIWG